MKRFFMMYDSDRTICGSCTHTYGRASEVKTAKGYISKCRQELAADHPHNFRIYDSWGDVEPATDFVPCVYQEE